MTRGRVDVRTKMCSKLVNLLNVTARVRTDQAFKEISESEYRMLQERASSLADHVDHVLRLEGCTGIAGAVGARVKHIVGGANEAAEE